MANGDIAAAAGITLVSPTGLVKFGYDEINRALDELVLQDNQRQNSMLGTIWPIAFGGTGSTSAPAALAALGAWRNSGAVTPGSAPLLGWDGARLRYEVPGYAPSAQLANYSDIALLLEKIATLTARVEALEAP